MIEKFSLVRFGVGHERSNALLISILRLRIWNSHTTRRPFLFSNTYSPHKVLNIIRKKESACKSSKDVLQAHTLTKI